MNYIRERVAYLKGLAEGMQISDSTNEGKLLKAIIDVLDDVALAVEDLEEVQEQMSEQIDDMDEDLAEVEKEIFGDDEEDDEDGCDCEECIGEFECPHCNQLVCLTEDMIDEKGEKLQCPNCKEEIEVEWECDCENCEDEDKEED